MHIPFFKPYITGKEASYINDLIIHRKDLSGDGSYTKKVHELLKKRYHVPHVLLTTSGTTALELAVRLLRLTEGDEIILPSFTFSSTANAVLLRHGIRPVFVDVKQDCTIDPDAIIQSLTAKTRALIVVHYAGISCDMDAIMTIAKDHHLQIIEDAAQAIESTYKGKQLGTIGNIGCLSFHDTKNISCGEGGAVFINTDDEEVWERAEIMREKGTDRSKFFRGQIDKYTWRDVGSSMLPSDILAAWLYAQMEHVADITEKRKHIYQTYTDELRSLSQSCFDLPIVPVYSEHNAHIFYLLCRTKILRDELLSYLRKRDIEASFHYLPLHSSPVGKRLGFTHSHCPITTQISDTIIRLPLYPDMTTKEQSYVIDAIRSYLRL